MAAAAVAVAAADMGVGQADSNTLTKGRVHIGDKPR